MKERLLAELNAAQEYFDRSTRNLEESDSAFTPSEGVFTAAQQVAHAAQTIDWFMEGAFRPEGFTMDFEDHERRVRAVGTLSEARTWFAKAVSNAKNIVESTDDAEWSKPLPAGPVMGGMPREAIFGAIVDHTAHHRGALTVYARLCGKTPPMPYMDM